MMRLSALIYLYRRRLRSHWLQELLAGLGVAIAVALVFTALLSESSIGSSAARVVRTVTGPASLQLRARTDEGFPEAILAPVQRLSGVRQAAPLLEANATVEAASGRSVGVQLAGTDLRLAVLDGLAETLPIGSLSTQGIGLSRQTAKALGIAGGAGRHRTVTLKLRGRSYPLRVTAVLGPEAASALSGAYAAVMPLARMQKLAGLAGRVSRIFVQTRPRAGAAVHNELSSLVGGQIEVAPANEDDALLRQALGPSSLASGLFAAIGALLGLLLAFSATLLTIADRRRAIADLRLAGARPAAVVEMVLFEALCLGVPASIVGVLTGYLLSTGAFHPATGYLAEAFTLSPGTIVSPSEVALSLAGGLLATCAASAVPLLDLRRGAARDAIYMQDGAPGNALSRVSKLRLAATATTLLVVASTLWLLLPSAAIPATALLALATVLAVPLAFAGVLSAAQALGERIERISILPLALSALRATTLRSLALAATGAVALFGTIALGGARENLLSGIHVFAHSYVSDAAVWISNPGDNQATESFTPASSAAGTTSFDGSTIAAQVQAVPGVTAVRSFQGGFVQLGDRRVWIIARPPEAVSHVLATQLVNGNLDGAVAKLRQGGWIVVSQQIAAERRLSPGEKLTLPTPTGPQSFRIAATSTNLAWPPGVIFMSAANYADAFRNSDPTALGVELAPGANATQVQAAIAARLGPASGLEVALASTRAKKIETLASEGLSQLQDVSTMLLVSAVVAMIAALASSAWQRRAGLASLRLLGARRLSLQAILLTEALLMMLAGCLIGAVAGIYGQVVIDAFLRHVTGFPLASPATSVRPLELFALVLLAGLIAGAIPGWLATRARLALAFAQE